MNNKADIIVTMLRQAYPRALSYADLWQPMLQGMSLADRRNATGGSTLRTLVKQGKVRKITEGFYVLVPGH